LQAPEKNLLRPELRETLSDAISQLPETYRSEETVQFLDLRTDVVKTMLW
jgi:hypothetical protein